MEKRVALIVVDITRRNGYRDTLWPLRRCDTLLSARNQSTHGYRSTVPYAPFRRWFSELCFIKGGENHTVAEWRQRRLHLSPRTRSFRPRKGKDATDKTYLEMGENSRASSSDKEQHGVCFSSFARRHSTTKGEISIGRPGLNNSNKSPSLSLCLCFCLSSFGPLTRKCNLLAPARCALTVVLLLFACRPHSTATVLGFLVLSSYPFLVFRRSV